MSENEQTILIGGEQVRQSVLNNRISELLAILNVEPSVTNADMDEALLMARALGLIGVGNDLAIWQAAVNRYESGMYTPPTSEQV